MSKTHFIRHGDHGFWAYDVAIGVFLKHLVDVAEPLVGDPGNGWLQEAIHTWRLGAVLYGLQIEETWSGAQKVAFTDLVRQACERLKGLEKIPAEEITAWPIIGDLRIFPRGAKEVATAPVIELGMAIADLANESLPDAPVGTWWCFGFPEGRATIRKREGS